MSRPVAHDRRHAHRIETGEAPVRIEWIQDLERIEALREPWDALSEEVRERTLFSRLDYVVPWYRNYRDDGVTPLVGAVWSEGGLVGVAPLAVWSGTLGRVPVRRVDFAGHTFDAGEFLVRDDAPEMTGTILESLLDEGGFDVVCLAGLEEGSPKFRAVREAAERRRHACVLSPYKYATVDLRAGWDAYCKGMTKNFRKNLRRHAERIAAAGPWKIDRVVPGAPAPNLEEFLRRIFAITDRSWKAQGSGSRPDRRRGFFREVIQRFEKRGMLDLAILSIGGQDAAFVAALVERGSYNEVTISYADDLKTLSPGTFLKQEILATLPGMGIHTLVSHGDFEYKQRWATGFASHVRAYVFSRGPRGILSRTTKFTLPRLWGRLRKHDA